MEVQELISKLGFDIDTSPLDKVDLATNSFKKTCLGLGGILTAITATLTASVLSAVNFGDSLARTSQKIGINVEDLQKLQYAATQVDITADELTQSLGLLSRRLFAAQNGSKEASAAFHKLGIDPKKITDTNQLILNLSDKFAKLKDGPQKAGIAMTLFSRSGLRMIPFLNQGSEKIRQMGQELKDLGLIFGDDFAKRSEEAHQNMERLNYIWKAFIRSAVAQFIPYLEKATDGLLEWIKANKEAIKTNLTAIFHAMGEVAKVLFEIIKAGAAIFSRLSEMVGGTKIAIEILIGAFVGFKALSLAKEIGKVAIKFFELANGIKAAAIAEKLFEAGPILLAIFAIIAGIKLGISIFEVMHGKSNWLSKALEAAFGKDFLKGFREGMKWFNSILDKARVDIFKSIYHPFDAVTQKVDEVINKFHEMMNVFHGGGGSFIGEIKKEIKYIAGGGDAGASSRRAGGSDSLGLLGDIGTPSFAGGGSSTMNYNPNTTVNISIAGGQGGDSDKTGQNVEDAVHRVLDKHYKKVKRVFTPQHS